MSRSGRGTAFASSSRSRRRSWSTDGRSSVGSWHRPRAGWPGQSRSKTEMGGRDRPGALERLDSLRPRCHALAHVEQDDSLRRAIRCGRRRWPSADKRPGNRRGQQQHGDRSATARITNHAVGAANADARRPGGRTAQWKTGAPPDAGASASGSAPARPPLATPSTMIQGFTKCIKIGPRPKKTWFLH